MPSLRSALQEIAAARKDDPLAPVTVVVPTHVAGLQLRRRLANIGPFASVRFETLSRVAELLAAGDLAASGRTPLARPIADYVTGRIARESAGPFSAIGDLPGYARVLRRMFGRLRRAGVRGEGELAADEYDRHLAEVLRLYHRFRQETASFYDEEDLYDAATVAVESRAPQVAAELGAIYVVPPPLKTAGGTALIEALQKVAPRFVEIGEEEGSPEVRAIISPDPSSEAREVVREVIAALGRGLGVHEVAVFHGSGPGYGKLLREAFDMANVPATYLPGIPLIETPFGKAALAVATLPEKAYSRTAMFDLLTAGALRSRLPGGHQLVEAFTTRWDRLAREAGITHGRERWQAGLVAYMADKDAELEGPRAEHESVRRALERDRKLAGDLLEAVQALIARLEPLREEQPATQLIARFKALLREYLRPDAPGFEQVEREVDQIGTVGAVNANMDLTTFSRALKANLEIAAVRQRSLGNGILVADYRIAGGLSFKHVVLCGAYEGALPAGPGSDALIAESTWSRLRETRPLLEDTDLIMQRNVEAARRAAATASAGTLVWSAPLGEPGGTREYYPSALMVEAARHLDESIKTATDLRRHGTTEWLTREGSAFATRLAGPPVDIGEANLRGSVTQRQQGIATGPGHARWKSVALLRSRRSDRFTAWDGNLSELAGDAWLDLSSAVSPTVLEDYGQCGFRFLCRSLLQLEAVEDPEEQDVIGAAVKGSLVHRVLQRFFMEQQAIGRPALGERWTPEDATRLTEIAREELAEARKRGLTGLEIYNRYATRVLLQDLSMFLERDSEFRLTHGLVPWKFESRIPEVEVAGARLRGVVDRVDWTPDGALAWVLDYKTGSRFGFDAIKMDGDPLAGGKKLQLPLYVHAAGDAAEVHAAYWFISRREDFSFVGYEPTPENQQRFAGTLGAIMDGVRAGVFPAVPGEDLSNCTFCDFDRVCSRRRDDEFSAKLGDPDYAAWLNVTQVAMREPAP